MELIQLLKYPIEPVHSGNSYISLDPCQKDPLEKEMATHSSILAWNIPWMEGHGVLQFMGLQRVGYD